MVHGTQIEHIKALEEEVGSKKVVQLDKPNSCLKDVGMTVSSQVCQAIGSLVIVHNIMEKFRCSFHYR
jgi:hypothetical protein